MTSSSPSDARLEDQQDKGQDPPFSPGGRADRADTVLLATEAWSPTLPAGVPVMVAVDSVGLPTVRRLVAGRLFEGERLQIRRHSRLSPSERTVRRGRRVPSGIGS